MFDLRIYLYKHNGIITWIFLLFTMYALAACNAIDPVPETTVSTSPVLIPFVGQGESGSGEQSEPVSPGQAENVFPEQTGIASSVAPEATSSAFNCKSPAALTPSLAEGPYYTPDTPERTSLLGMDMDGTRLVLTGFVLTQDCQPISGAWLDFWQTDAEGEYDNIGYRLRGHQFTDTSGRYQLETIIPGEYPGRPQHIHVKVQAPGGPVLTTQLYFPASAGNENDRFFLHETLLRLQETDNGFISTFDFIVEE